VTDPRDPLAPDAGDTATAERDRYADWPVKGGGDTDTPQPWDLKGQGISAADQAELGDGDPDTVSPIVPRAGLELLTYGSQGPAVRDLAVRLGELGYSNSISRGSVDNAFNVYDESVASAVEAFRRDYDVAEDPSQFGRDPRASAISHVGPWTTEAILRASDREREDRG
jgi:peptidoglycan hydrolase-like protein with peptidoglycan-binding domain